MNLSRRRVRFRFQSFYVYSTWYLNQFEFYKRRSAVLKSQSIIEQLRCTDFYKFLNVWLFLNDWLFLNVLMFDHPPTSDGNRFQFPKSIIGNKSNSILELESVSWCVDCGIWIHNSKSLEIHLPRYWCDMPPIQHTLLCLETAIFHSCSLT